MAGAQHLLEIEERLAADASGAERDALLGRLEALRVETKRGLDRGLPPEEARRSVALLAALDAAGLVVRGVWAYLHHAGR